MNKLIKFLSMSIFMLGVLSNFSFGQGIPTNGGGGGGGGSGGGGGGGGGGSSGPTTNSIGTATGMTITLTPGWNVFSTPAILSNISFSNGGYGISFSRFENGQWISITANTGEIQPLEGFLVENTNTDDINMEITYDYNISPTQAFLQKDLNVGWNFLGITTSTNPFSNIAGNVNMTIDFTYGTDGNSHENYLNKVHPNFVGNQNSNTITTPQYGEAYGAFITSNNAIYGGINNKTTQNGSTNPENPNEGCSAEELLACFNADDYDACIAHCSYNENLPENPNEGCSVEELLACFNADDYDACIAHCSYNENLDVYSLITGTLFIAPGTENVELFKAKLISTNANGIEITDYEIDATNFNSGLFSNLKVYVDGVQYDWDMNSSNLVFNNNDSFDIPAGSLVYVKIIGDIADNVVTNNPVRFKLILNTGYDTITNSYINFYGQSTHGPDVSIIYPYFTLKNENTINNHYSIIPGNESTVRNFNIHQYIEDTNLSHISFYYSGTTGLSTMISSACLESEDYSISCINDELPDINTGYLMFNDFNILVQKDALLNLSLELIAEDEFSNIGNILEFTLHTGNINLQGSLGSGGSIQSEQIRIVGEVPEITLTKDGEDILMTIQNISKYGLEIGEIKYRILCNIGNSSQDCVEGTAVILDSINGIEVGTSGNFPGRITSQIGQGYGLIESNDNLTYNIHLNSNYIIESDYYTVDISSLKYRYLNDNNITDWIEVQYNVSL